MKVSELWWPSTKRQMLTSIRFTPPLHKRPPLHPHHHVTPVWRNFTRDLCTNLSLHGLPHISNRQRLICERVVWSVVVLIASLATAITGYNSWLAYRHPTITTTVVTTRNECSNFPFPSLSLCDTSRVDWQRALNLTQQDLPNGQNVSLDHVLTLLKALAEITFGDFDFLDNLADNQIKAKEFGKLDIAKLLKMVQRPCEEIFVGPCWWREKFYDCCSLFELQRTDLGYCYSFNQDLSEKSQGYATSYGKKDQNNYWVDWNGEVRPRRASISGPWTGLRFTYQAMLPEQVPSGTNITPGIYVSIRAWMVV